ncbi:hypothetical protein EVJ58_g259 [Rhodofomes roseus]|uniref:Uncharacterized protein n=1 Tax=Rhodofomes roseus TaxID=34475 RepID=A0A4Y9Z6M4_9APHY|nr:hypothetical protein EVJ58_g259 [Rhodofomes roseus]
MSEEEKKKATKDYKSNLQEVRDSKCYAQCKTRLSVHHDMQDKIATTKVMLLEVADRTGLQSLAINMRGSPEDWTKPHVFFTHEGLSMLFNLFMHCPLALLATQLEAYIVCGEAEVVQPHKQQLLQAKKELAILVLKKLNTTL